MSFTTSVQKTTVLGRYSSQPGMDQVDSSLHMNQNANKTAIQEEKEASAELLRGRPPSAPAWCAGSEFPHDWMLFGSLPLRSFEDLWNSAKRCLVLCGQQEDTSQSD